MVRDSCLHRRSAPDGAVNPDKIIVCEVERYRSLQILQLLAEGTGKPGEPSHAHPHSKVLALHKASGNVRNVRIALNWGSSRAHNMRRAISSGADRSSLIAFDDLAVINLQAKSLFGSIHVCRQSVGRKLDPVREASSQIVQKCHRISQIALPDSIGGNQLSLRIERNPGILIANSGSVIGGAQVALLLLNKAPNLILLDLSAR